MKKIISLVCAVSLALLLFSCTKKGPSAEIGKLAPDFTLTDINGNSVRLADMKGRVVMVEFWATWCPPCRESTPVLNELYRKYRDRGFTLLGVSIDKGQDVRADVNSFVKELSISYPVFLDTDDVYLSYKVINVPSSFMIDKNGRIAHSHIGYLPGMAESLTKEIEALL